MSDNGASGEGGPNGSFNEWRFFNGVADTAETTLPHLDELGTSASNNHYNTGWAWALDTPFPYWKRWAGAEGGVADMCVVSWPAQDRARRIEPRRPVRPRRRRRPDASTTSSASLRRTRSRAIEQLAIEGESFAAALADADAAGKSTQFYAMLGQRSIYHDGWLACTVHPPLSSWGHFEHDEWELFHLEVDRSQYARTWPPRNRRSSRRSRASGSTTPASTTASRSTTGPPSSRSCPSGPRAAGARDQYTFYPNAADVPESAGPAPPGRSYTVAAGVKIETDAAKGVLWAAGGVPGGHSLYIKDSKLRYTYNWIGTVLQDVISDRTIPTGAHVFAADFAVSGPSADPAMPGAAGTLTLYIDDEAVGSAQIVTQPGYFCLTGDGICVGRVQLLGRHPGVPGTVPFHRRDHRQGRRRCLRRGLRRHYAKPRCEPGSASTDGRRSG